MSMCINISVGHISGVVRDAILLNTDRRVWIYGEWWRDVREVVEGTRTSKRLLDCHYCEGCMQYFTDVR